MHSDIRIMSVMATQKQIDYIQKIAPRPMDEYEYIQRKAAMGERWVRSAKVAHAFDYFKNRRQHGETADETVNLGNAAIADYERIVAQIAATDLTAMSNEKASALIDAIKNDLDRAKAALR